MNKLDTGYHIPYEYKKKTKKNQQNLTVLAQGIVNAWIVEGSHPDYHKKVKEGLKISWPSLYYAIETFINAQ